MGLGDTLSAWSQGDLVRDVPLTWIAPAGTDAVTGGELAQDVEGPVGYEQVRAAAAVICTQTCDLGSAPPGDRVPFVLLAPLVPYEEFNTSTRKLAREGRIGYLVPAQPEGLEGDWFVDLRMIVPASKAVLLERSPVRGFADEAAALRFAEALAYRFRRPALHGALSDELVRDIEEYLRGLGAVNQAVARVRELRLLVLGGTRLNPERVQLVVLADPPLDPPMQAMWQKWEPRGKGVLTPHGVELAPTIFTDLHELRADMYRSSVPLSVKPLPAPSW
ncbi:MAG: hypothetical protein AB7G36_16970 [Candidatus Nanopelagicales bacterium]